MSTDIVERLEDHATAWGVSADTPDVELINEGRMAKDCACAAIEIRKLRAALAASDAQWKELEAWLEHSACLSFKSTGEKRNWQMGAINEALDKLRALRAEGAK